MSSDTAAALARTVQLIGTDVFGTVPGTDPGLEGAIVEGLTSTTVGLVADEANLSSHAGQTALVSLFALVAMMGIGIDLDIPETDVLGLQPRLRGLELRAALLSYGRALIPSARVGRHIGQPDLTFVLGDTLAPEGDRVLRVSGDAWRCIVARRECVGRWEGEWPIGAFAAAATAAAEAFRCTLDSIAKNVGAPARPPRFTLDLDRSARLNLFVGGGVPNHLSLGDVDMVSGGAITTSALYCLTRTPNISGRIRIIEPDVIDLSNLNRYPLAMRSDCGRPKTDILKEFATERLVVDGVRERFTEESNSRIGGLTRVVLVGVDDIPSRWAVQRAAEGWVCVAGTSHFYALVTTHRPGEPCAGCVHPRDDDMVGPIPTISFVSFWAGLMQARALLIASTKAVNEAAVNVWPLGLYGARGLHFTSIAPCPDCPVGCSAAGRRLVAK